MGFFGFFGCFFNANPATRRIWEEPSILNLQWHAPPPASSCRSEIKDFLSYRSKTAIYLSLGLHKVCPGHRRSLQLTKEAIQHFKTWFFFLNVIFALLDPDPYSKYGSGSNGPTEYGKNLFRIPDPGVKKHPIPDPDPQHWFSGCYQHHTPRRTSQPGVYILENTPPPPDGEKIPWKQRACADKKGEKERKDKGKEKIRDKKTEQEQCFIKLWETWRKKNAGNRGHNIIFFPLLF